jgi:DNA-binding transcriptional ArsR family regulator
MRHHSASCLCFEAWSFGIKILECTQDHYGADRSDRGGIRAGATYVLTMTLQNIDMAMVGALIGEPARANILAALMDGRALTATELAYIAGVAPQTASGHLAKLADANLITLTKQGRHRYYRLASVLVARMLEGIMAVASVQVPPRRRTVSRADTQMSLARTCYDHIAGRLGVALADALVERGQIMLTEDGGDVTPSGTDFLSRFGIDLPSQSASKKTSHRAFCRPCLDWSERRPHIAGMVGAALCRRCLELAWIERGQDTRALAITAKGLRGFSEIFGIDLPVLTEPPAVATKRRPFPASGHQDSPPRPASPRGASG